MSRTCSKARKEQGKSKEASKEVKIAALGMIKRSHLSFAEEVGYDEHDGVLRKVR
jgi:hypothetical protein